MDLRKKELVRDIIRQVHGGLSVEEARARIEGEVGSISSSEITAIEQSLIDEGMPAEEIRRFCNVHAALFESSLAREAGASSTEGPLAALQRENREIELLVAELRAAATLDAARSALARLRVVDRHYVLKENGIFPLLEAHGFPGPSRVMWAKHDEVRELLRKSTAAVESAKDDRDLAPARESLLAPLAAEILGMIFKEENVLFPAVMERIPRAEWGKVMESFRELGLADARETGAPRRDADRPAAATGTDGTVRLPSGSFSTVELGAALDVLPVDVTFVDAEDTVRYFNQTRDRIFPRAVSVVGRKVQNCHPPASLHKVNEILQSFRQGTRDQADFWIQRRGRFVSIRYFAVRDPEGRYLGCLEVSQDLTELRTLSGERRLLSES